MRESPTIRDQSRKVAELVKQIALTAEYGLDTPDPLFRSPPLPQHAALTAQAANRLRETISGLAHEALDLLGNDV